MYRITAHRVAQRYSRHIEAFEFSSPEELKKYLSRHPDADRSKHTVQKQQKPKGKKPPLPPGKGKKPEEAVEGKPQQPEGKKGPPPLPQQKKPQEAPSDQGHPEGTEAQSPKGSILQRLKGLSSGAIAAFKAAPAGAKKFFQDEGHRKAVLGKMGKAILAAPKEYKAKLVETAKHEVHEFKLASQGIKAAFSGKPLSKGQKAAIKAVSIHMGVTLAAASMGATGVVAGMGAAASAMAKHIALKAATKSLGHLHVMQEAGHVGHGLMDILSRFAAEEGKHKPEDVMAALVMQSVQDVLAEMDDEGLKSILEYTAKASGGTPKKPVTEESEDTEAGADEETSDEDNPFEDQPEAKPKGPPPKVKTAAGPGLGLADLCEQAETVHRGLRAWIRQFPQVLAKAEQEAVGLDEGLVWQDRLVDYWKELEVPMKVLEDIDDQIEFYPREKLSITWLVNEARQATWERGMSIQARIEYGFGKPQFVDNQIAYFVTRLEEWAAAFEKWNEESLQILHKVARKARRVR
jgi:mRNA-degrading endonuclease HigB of HigAB toxin-antitoxin module